MARGNKALVQLGARIRRARQTARLSQAQLAHAVRVSDKSISAYEQGRSVPPLSKLKLIAESTEHSMAYFTKEDVGEEEVGGKLARIEKELEAIKKLLTK